MDDLDFDELMKFGMKLTKKMNNAKLNIFVYGRITDVDGGSKN